MKKILSMGMNLILMMIVIVLIRMINNKIMKILIQIILQKMQINLKENKTGKDPNFNSNLMKMTSSFSENWHKILLLKTKVFQLDRVEWHNYPHYQILCQTNQKLLRFKKMMKSFLICRKRERKKKKKNTTSLVYREMKKMLMTLEIII